MRGEAVLKATSIVSLTTCLIILPFAALNAEEIDERSVGGFIVDEDNQPIEGVIVRLQQTVMDMSSISMYLPQQTSNSVCQRLDKIAKC
jgi:hypothetical protein